MKIWNNDDEIMAKKMKEDMIISNENENEIMNSNERRWKW